MSRWRHPYEARTNDELFELAFLDDSELDGDPHATSALAAVRFLADRNTPEVFEMAKKHCRSTTARHRQRGLQVLTRLSWDDEAHPQLHEMVELGIRCIHDVDPAVVQAAAWALAYLDDERAERALMAFRNDASPEIRHAVAFGLAGGRVDGSISALLKLMEDPDEAVRDAATASLGKSPQHDTPEIREAFRRRLSDADEEAHDDAIYALALRQDPQGLRILLSRLQGDSWTVGDEEVACEVLGFKSTDTERLCDRLRALLAR